MEIEKSIRGNLFSIPSLLLVLVKSHFQLLESFKTFFMLRQGGGGTGGKKFVVHKRDSFSRKTSISKARFCVTDSYYWGSFMAYFAASTTTIIHHHQK